MNAYFAVSVREVYLFGHEVVNKSNMVGSEEQSEAHAAEQSCDVLAGKSGICFKISPKIEPTIAETRGYALSQKFRVSMGSKMCRIKIGLHVYWLYISIVDND